MPERVLAVLLLAAVCPGAGLPAPAPRPAVRSHLDGRRILGTWQVVEIAANGKHPAREVRKPQVWVVTRDRITVRHQGGHTDEFAYTLGPDRKPATIDLTPAKGSATRSTFLGVYELEGNRLKVCRARGRRPAQVGVLEFERGHALLVLERVRAGEGGPGRRTGARGAGRPE